MHIDIDAFKYVDGELHWKELKGTRKNPIGARDKRGYLLHNRTTVHRLIWQVVNGPIPEGMVIDHIDGDPGNNLIENLRLCTSSENNRNRGPGKNNTSGEKNVTWSKVLNKWVVKVNLHGEVTKRFCETFDEAVQTARDLRKELHGEFRKD